MGKKVPVGGLSWWLKVVGHPQDALPGNQVRYGAPLQEHPTLRLPDAT